MSKNNGRNGQTEKPKEKPIPIPAVTAARLREVLGRLKHIEREFNLVLRTAQETLGVPEGWGFDMKRSAFVPPRPKPARPVQRGKK